MDQERLRICEVLGHKVDEVFQAIDRIKKLQDNIKHITGSIQSLDRDLSNTMPKKKK